MKAQKGEASSPRARRCQTLVTTKEGSNCERTSRRTRDGTKDQSSFQKLPGDCGKCGPRPQKPGCRRRAPRHGGEDGPLRPLGGRARAGVPQAQTAVSPLSKVRLVGPVGAGQVCV